MFTRSDWRRASVGRSVGPADWPRVLGAVDKPPGRVWIDFIRQALEDSQSIVFVPVTGPLISPTVFSCRDADFTDRFSRYRIVCDKDWVLPAGYQVLLQNYAKYSTMDADGFSIIDNRAGSRLELNCMCHGTRRRWSILTQLVLYLYGTCHMSS